jgi:dolichol-phosphate mannosyltransferase
MRYSVVVPVYNEGANIAAFCARFVDELPEDGELLIVYDRDDDDTLPALAQIPAGRRPENLVTIRNTLGRGARNAIVSGMQAANAPVVLVMMADLSDDFSRVEEMIARAEAGAEVVCASRYMRGGQQIGGPWLKGMMSRFAGVSLHALGALPVHDPTNSFKAYRRAFLEATPIETQEGFALAMELTVKAQLAGRRVEEVPATWRDRSAGESRFQLRKWLGTYLHWYVRALVQRSVLWTVLLPLAMLLAIGMIVPVRLDFNMTTEYWLVVALHEAFLRGMHFGSDLVFTFGPWGFLLNGFHPRTVDLTFFLRTAIVVIGLLTLWKTIEARSGRRSFAVMTIFVLAGAAYVCWSDAYFLFIPPLILLEGFERADRKSSSSLYFLLIAAGTLLGLAKFSMLVMVSVAVAAVAVDEIRRRTFPWSAAVHALAVAAFWLIARQRVVDFVPFVRSSLELASGYGEAMGINDVLYSPRAFRPFVISALSFTVILAFIELRRSFLRGLLLLGGWSALLLLLFKSGFVRADHFHLAPAAGVLLLTQLTYLTTRLRRNGPASLLLIVPIVFSIYLVELFGDRGIMRDVSGTLRTGSRNAGRLVRWPSFREEMYQLHREALAAVASPPLPMRADTYPAPYGVILQPGFTWQPRPAYVSYAVYTPRLAQLNAEWLDKSRPPYVLFDLEAIDHQLPSMQDGASWPLLLAHYEVKGQAGKHLILQRRPSPSSAALTLLTTRSARFGEKVPLPSQELVFARFAVALTRRGKFESVFYKTPPLQIRVGLADGTEKKFRFIRRMAESEFLLSPLVQKAGDFAALYAGKNPHAVRWIVVETKQPDGSAAYEAVYGMEFLGK